jgi:hypothetical protein
MIEEHKPKPGAMQIKGGKMSLYLNDEWVDFGVMYVAKDMRKIAKPLNGRRNGYAPVLHRFADELEAKGLAAVKTVQERLKAFWGAREKWMAQDCRVWHSWLNQIYQFRNCTGKKDKPIHAEANKNFSDNFDKIFNQPEAING